MSSRESKQGGMEMSPILSKLWINISKVKYKTLLNPFLSFAEQRYIVEKLEQMLPLCVKLK